MLAQATGMFQDVPRGRLISRCNSRHCEYTVGTRWSLKPGCPGTTDVHFRTDWSLKPRNPVLRPCRYFYVQTYAVQSMSHLTMLAGRTRNPCIRTWYGGTYMGTDMLGPKKSLAISCLHRAIRGLLCIVPLHRIREYSHRGLGGGRRDLREGNQRDFNIFFMSK